MGSLARTIARARGQLAVALAVSATCLAACGSNNDGPAAPGGLYRLAAVGGLPLPYVCPPGVFAPTCTVPRGELLLRSDGSFVESIGGLQVFLEGTYSASANEVQFSLPPFEPGGSPINFNARLDGDSLVADGFGSLIVTPSPLHLVFRRSTIPSAPIRDAAFALSQVNGKSDSFVESDTVLSGTRYVYRVDFDSLVFLDGMFFKQHRRTSNSAYLANGDSLTGDDETRTFGTFTGNNAWFVLDRASSLDSLAVGPGTTLTRRIRLRANAVLEELYSRSR